MSAPAHFAMLRELLDRFDRVTPEQVIIPEVDRPDGAQLLGYAPFHLQQIWTVYRQVSDACAVSPEAKQEALALDALTKADQEKAPGVVMDALLQALDDAQAEVSVLLAKINLIWACFLAEAAVQFPSAIFCDDPTCVVIYSDWSIAIEPEEEESESEQVSHEPAFDRPRLLH